MGTLESTHPHQDDQQSAKMSQQQPPSDQSEYLASGAAGQCIKGAKAAVKNTVVKRADRQPTGTGNGNGQSDGASRFIETQQPPVTGHWYDPAGRARDCDQCGREYQAKRSSSRFCSGRCRLRAHKARHNTN